MNRKVTYMVELTFIDDYIINDDLINYTSTSIMDALLLTGLITDHVEDIAITPTTTRITLKRGDEYNFDQYTFNVHALKSEQ